MKKIFKCVGILIVGLISFVRVFSQPGSGDVSLGAYYFDGWTGAYPYHITKSLTDTFSEREPKWGWITSTQNVVDSQIEYASNAGLSFFSFCWYYTGKQKINSEPLNNALRLYHTSTQRNKLKYCLLIVNHGFGIGPNEWPIVVDNWISEFKSDTYLFVDEKPLLIFYSVNDLIKAFRSETQVKTALDSLRSVAKANGLDGVTIAACVMPDSSNVALAQECGFDILTGYNYHGVGFSQGKTEIPIDSLQQKEMKVWNKFPKITNIKYIPAVTLNWDPRPWATDNNGYRNAPHFIGYSPHSVSVSVQNCLKWLKENPQAATKEKLAILYAWNENGEGAYLTPSKKGPDMLNAVKDVILTNQ